MPLLDDFEPLSNILSPCLATRRTTLANINMPSRSKKIMNSFFAALLSERLGHENDLAHAVKVFLSQGQAAQHQPHLLRMASRSSTPAKTTPHQHGSRPHDCVASKRSDKFPLLARDLASTTVG